MKERGSGFGPPCHSFRFLRLRWGGQPLRHRLLLLLQAAPPGSIRRHLPPNRQRSTRALTSTVRESESKREGRKEREKRIRAFVFSLSFTLPRADPPASLSLILVPSPSQEPNAATLLGCFSRCTSPFKPCCKEEHDAFWACYREKRKTGGGEGSKKISVLPFPRSKAKPDP